MAWLIQRRGLRPSPAPLSPSDPSWLTPSVQFSGLNSLLTSGPVRAGTLLESCRIPEDGAAGALFTLVDGVSESSHVTRRVFRVRVHCSTLRTPHIF